MGGCLRGASCVSVVMMRMRMMEVRVTKEV